MKIERDSENNIIMLKNDEEIHPYLSVLSAIELQQKVIPPLIPELTTQGWDVVKSALNEAIENLQEVEKHEVVITSVNSEEPEKIIDTSSNDTSSVVISTKKPIKPIYKVG